MRICERTICAAAELRQSTELFRRPMVDRESSSRSRLLPFRGQRLSFVFFWFTFQIARALYGLCLIRHRCLNTSKETLTCSWSTLIVCGPLDWRLNYASTGSSFGD